MGGRTQIFAVATLCANHNARKPYLNFVSSELHVSSRMASLIWQGTPINLTCKATKVSCTMQVIADNNNVKGLVLGPRNIHLSSAGCHYGSYSETENLFFRISPLFLAQLNTDCSVCDNSGCTSVALRLRY